MGVFCYAQNNPTKIDVDISEAKVNVSEVFSSVEFIKLETPKESLLTYPVDFQIVDDYIIIFDGTLKVYMYTKTGKFVRQIGKTGRGPGEYSQLTDVFVDKENHLIEILEDFKRRILVYDFNGNFIKENIGLVAKSFGKDKKGNYLFFSEYYGLYGKNVTDPLNTQVLLANSTGTVLSTFEKDFVPMGKFIAPVNASCIKEFAGELIFNPHRSCTIYRLADESLLPYYQIDFGEKNVPKKYLLAGEELEKETYKYLQSNYVTEVLGFLETNKNVYFWFHFGRNTYYTFYNIENAKSITVNRSNFVNDLAFVDFYFPKGRTDNKLINYLPSIDFKKQLDDYMGKMTAEKANNFKLSNPRLYDIYQNSTIDDNPIIIIYNFIQ
jgi:hypothetical protein